MVHEEKYLAEADVELIETNDNWSPCLSLEDAYKLDDVREALRREICANINFTPVAI